MAERANRVSRPKPKAPIFQDAPYTPVGLATPAVNVAAVVTLAAPGVAGNRHVIGSIDWSYNAAPTGGRLTITDNAVVVFDKDITAAGPGQWTSPVPGLMFGVNTQVVVTLAAAGAAVTGKLVVAGRQTNQ